MSGALDWFRDDGLLQAEIRRGFGARGGSLEILGYDDIAQIGRGGQAIVYRAVQRSTKRPVAIKVVLDGIYAAPSAARRFEREVDLAASLRHPHIVSVYDSGVTADHRPYLVMELVDGPALDEFLGSRPGNLREQLKLFATICDAVQYAHQRGVIHRDLKPSNIRVDASGSPRILDFGLAKPAPGQDASSLVTMTGQFVGSLAWASPEQARSDHENIDVRSDIYSLGVMFYQLLTGRYPYDVEGGIRQALDNIVNAPPERPSTTSPLIDTELETILLRCLAKEPERRYQSAGELARDIRHYLAGEPIAARRDSAWYMVRKTLRRYQLVVAAASVVLVLSIVFGITMTALYGRATRAEAAAEQRFHEADDARRDAETKAKTTRQTLAFIGEMLQSINPETAQGRDVSVLREMLDDAAARVASELTDQPEVAAAALAEIGCAYHRIGMNAAAIGHLRDSITRAESIFGSDDVAVLTTRDALGCALAADGKLNEALAEHRVVVPALERVLGLDDLRTLRARNNLASTEMKLSDVVQAERRLRDTIEREQRVLAADHAETRRSRMQLGVMLVELNRLDEAEALLEDVLQREREARGNDHPQTILALAHTAGLRVRQGRFSDAEQILREVLARHVRVLGEKHVSTCVTLSNLGEAVQNQGRSAEAEQLYREAIAGLTATVGDRSPHVLLTMGNLGALLMDQRRLGEAQSLLADSLDGMRQLYGEDNERTLKTINNLAKVYQAQGRLDDAEPLFRRVAGLAAGLRGDDYPETLIYRNNLADILLARAQSVEAEQILVDVFDRAQRAMPPGHWLIFNFERNLGRALAAQRRYDEARAHLQSALDGLTRSLGAQHERTLRTRGELADVCEAAGDHAAATMLRTEQKP